MVHTQPTWQWATRGGGSHTTSFNPDEMFTAMESDSLGNIYICGNILDQANVDGTPITTYGSYDIFIAKYDCGGNLIWKRTAGGAFDDVVYSLVIDTLGYIYITGELNASPLAPANLFGDTVSENTFDLYLTKLDTAGNLIWNKIACPGSATCYSRGQSLKLKSNGNISMLFYRNKANDTTLYELFPGDSIKGNGWWIGEFDTSGNILNKMKMYNVNATGTNNIKNLRYAISSSDEHYISFGFTNDSVLVDNTWFYHLNNGGIGMDDVILLKLNRFGSLKWYHQFTDTSSSFSGLLVRSDDIKIISGKEVFVSGAIRDGNVVGNDTTYNNSGGTCCYYPFIAKFDSSGNGHWITTINTFFAGESSGGIAVAQLNKIVFSGIVTGNFQFGASSFNGGGLYKIFISDISLNGYPIQANIIDSVGVNSMPLCMTTSKNNVYVAGAFSGSMTINGTTITSAGGATDAFVVKYGTANCVVGIDELQVDNAGLLIYPNPASGEVTILPAEAHHIIIHKTELYNLLGEKVQEQENRRAKEVKIAVANLASGLYFVKVYTEGGVVTGKVMKE
jgi:hypothetical protein